MLLVKRSRKDGVEIAQEMGINQSSLSRLYKSHKLTIKIKRAAAAVLGVDLSVFETGYGYDIPFEKLERVGEAEVEYRALMEENARLREENARIAADLLREKEVSDDLRRALVLIAGKGTD